jgi:hypothetical protein
MSTTSSITTTIKQLTLPNNILQHQHSSKTAPPNHLLQLTHQ